MAHLFTWDYQVKQVPLIQESRPVYYDKGSAAVHLRSSDSVIAPLLQMLTRAGKTLQSRSQKRLLPTLSARSSTAIPTSYVGVRASATVLSDVQSSAIRESSRRI